MLPTHSLPVNQCEKAATGQKNQYIKRHKQKQNKRIMKSESIQSLLAGGGGITIWRGRTRRDAQDSAVGSLCSRAFQDRSPDCRHLPPASALRVRQALKHNRE